MIVGLGIYVVVSDGYYPVAFVNGTMITGKDLNTDYNAALFYFKNALLTYGSNPQVLEKDVSQEEIRRATLDKIISDMLIYTEAKQRLGDELDKLSTALVSENFQDQKLADITEKIYGLSAEDFKVRVLKTQAYRELVARNMNDRREDFDAWLANAKQHAHVIILVPNLSWQDGSVVKD